MSWGFVRKGRGIGWDTLIHVTFCGSVGKFPMAFLKKPVLYYLPRNLGLQAISRQTKVFTYSLTYIHTVQHSNIP